jgi:hypothetical protein
MLSITPRAIKPKQNIPGIITKNVKNIISINNIFLYIGNIF